jgi:hypothetical protein
MGGCNDEGVLLGFQGMKALAVVTGKLPGARIYVALTSWEDMEENGELVKYRVRMTVRRDQQVAGESFVATDLYAPVLKTHEVRLQLAIPAAEGCLVYKTDTSQAFLYGGMGNAVVYIRAQDWWEEAAEPIPEDYCLKLLNLKSIYGTRQAALRWHNHMGGSEWLSRG